jgi:hypothetical protein
MEALRCMLASGLIQERAWHYLSPGLGPRSGAVDLRRYRLGFDPFKLPEKFGAPGRILASVSLPGWSHY